MPRRAFDPMVAIRESAAHDDDHDHDYNDAELEDESEPEVNSQLPPKKRKLNAKPAAKAVSNIEPLQFAKDADFLNIQGQKIGSARWWRQILSLDRTWTMIRVHTPKAFLQQRMPTDINDHLMADKAAAKEKALNRKKSVSRADDVSVDHDPASEDEADEMAELAVQPEMPSGPAFPRPVHVTAQALQSTTSTPLTRNARKAPSKKLLHTTQDHQTIPDFGPHNHANSHLPQASELDSSFYGIDPTDPSVRGPTYTPPREQTLEDHQKAVERAIQAMRDFKSNKYSVDDLEAEARVSATSSNTKEERPAKDVSSTQGQLQGSSLAPYEGSDTIPLRRPTPIKDELTEQSSTTTNADVSALSDDDIIEVIDARSVRNRRAITRIKAEPVEQSGGMACQKEEEQKAKIDPSEEKR